MDKNIQDIAWACLPKEARLSIVQLYVDFQAESKGDYINRPFWVGIIRKFESIYGHHNLASAIEPEEMLMVERETILNIYEANERIIDGSQWSDDHKDKAIHVNSLFETLFGNKCLPDPIVLNVSSGGGGMNLKPPAYKLDVKTKHISTEDVCKVLGVEKDDSLVRKPDRPSVQVESKKFFKSDYCIGDKVIIAISSIGNPRKEVVTLIRQYQPQCEYNEYAKTWVVQTQTGMTYQSNEEHFEPYTEPETKDAYEQYQDAKAEEYDNQLKDNIQLNSWEAEFKKMNECFEKIQKTLSSLYETWGKIEDGINKLNRL